jgi:hypothetical protein
MRIRLMNVALIERGLEADVDIGTAVIPAFAAGRRVRLSNVQLIAGGLEADAQGLDAAPAPEPIPDPATLPLGFDTDPAIALGMLERAMNEHGLTPTGVQGHGQQIVDALNDTFPGLNVYLASSDAPVWPGFGSVDVTIDSGKGGWQFRRDRVTPYERDPAKR